MRIRTVVAAGALAAGGLVATPGAAHASTYSICPIHVSRPHYAVERGYIAAMRSDSVGYTCHPYNQGIVTGYTVWETCHRKYFAFIPYGWGCKRSGNVFGWGGKFNSHDDSLSVAAWTVCRKGHWRATLHAASYAYSTVFRLTMHSAITNFKSC